MSLEVLQNKIQNAQKRFRQGRIPYKKLQSIVQACRQEALLLVSKEASEQGHVHGPDCSHELTHEDEVVLDGAGFSLDATPLVPHVCSEDHDHSGGDV